MKITQYLSYAASGLYAVRVYQDESGSECCERAPVRAGDENGLVVGDWESIPWYRDPAAILADGLNVRTIGE
jgi:hypothetical protein